MTTTQAQTQAPYQLVAVPAKLHKVIIRVEYLAITNGDACAAALLNGFERFTAWKLRMKQEPWLYVEVAELQKDLLGMFSGYAIRRGLKLLRVMKLVETARASEHKYDQALKYMLNVAAVQDAVDTLFADANADDSTGDDHPVDDNTTVQAGSTRDLLVGNAPLDRLNPSQSISQDSTDGDVESFAMEMLNPSVSTLEDQVLDQDSSNQESTDQAAATGAREAAAAGVISKNLREGLGFSKTFLKMSARARLLTSPPSSALPPLHEAAVRCFEANIGKAGEAVRAAICAAAEKHGEALVIEKIELGALRNARTWAYIAKMLPMMAETRTWNDSADETERPINTGYSYLEMERQRREAERAAMSADERVWADTLYLLELQMPRETFDLWVRGATLIGVEDNRYVIGVANIYARDMVNTRLHFTVQRALREHAGQQATVQAVAS